MPALKPATIGQKFLTDCGQNRPLTTYIKHKLKVAGASESIIGDDALTAISGYCKGNPRLIDNVMTTALKAGYQMQKTVIDADVILAAVNEQALG